MNSQPYRFLDVRVRPCPLAAAQFRWQVLEDNGRGRLWLTDGSCIRLRPEHRNHVWSYDFVEDRILQRLIKVRGKKLHMHQRRPGREFTRDLADGIVGQI